jgi:hypothetical protein
MSIAPGKARISSPPKIQYISPTKWDKGVYSRLDSDRVPQDGLTTTENVQLNQNGVIEPRPGLKLYGTQPTNPVLGQVYEYVKMNGTVAETWLIWMENRSTVGTVITAKDGGTQTVVTGKTYSGTAKAHFEQIYGKVLITNGVDNLSYMDTTTQTITAYTSLASPSAVTATATVALTSSPAGFIGLRYRAAGANQGETAASTASVATVNKLRESWNGTTETVTITGTIPTGTSRVNIYVGQDIGNEMFLDSITVSTAATSFTYTDTGSIAENPNRIAPVGDSTAGPKTLRATNIKGQVYMCGDADNPGRVWFGGSGTYALDFSSFNGGGWVEPNKGGKDFPVVVKPFRDGKGTPTAVCFSKGTNGSGKRYLLQPATTTLGTTTISYMSVQEDNGQDGTDSPDGVVMLNDGAFYPSRSNFKTSNTKANIQNIISTQGITDNISTNVLSLSSVTMDSCVGVPNDQRIYWALPNGTPTNNEIWVLDLRQGGAWVRPWYIAADWLTLYADNTTGQTKMLALVNNQICELDTATPTNDNGTAFSTNINSGAYKFSEDGAIWGSVIDVTFIFLRPQGNINVSVTANTEDGIKTFSDTLAASAKQSVSALGLYGLGAVGLGNLAPGAMSVPVSSALPRVPITIPIDEEVNYLNFSVNTADAGIYYQLAEVIVRYVSIGWKDLDNS